LEAAVRPAAPLAVFAADLAVALFCVVDLPAGRLAVALRAVALLAAPVPCRRAAGEARLAAADLDAVDLLEVFFVVTVPLRADETGVVFFPAVALRATAVFFAAVLAVADPVAPLEVALLPPDFLAAAFFAGFFATLLLVDLRGLVVAMRVSSGWVPTCRGTAFDSTAAMQAK